MQIIYENIVDFCKCICHTIWHRHIFLAQRSRTDYETNVVKQ